MPHALSNPYEITVDGITCKASPYNAGWYIAANDFYKLGDNREAFEKALLRDYAAEKLWSGNPPTQELEGIRVYYLKPKIEQPEPKGAENGKIDEQEKKQPLEIGIRTSVKESVSDKR